MKAKKYASKEQIERAKQIDLLTYLQTYEPDELIKIAPGIYSTREHDSLKISNGKWCWWSKNIGGRSALDYLIKVKGMAFTDAVILLSNDKRASPVKYTSNPQPEKAPFRLPEAYTGNERVINYLINRGIDQSIVDFCIKDGMLYEDTHHNCVFVGFDGDVSKYAMLRSTLSNSTFMGESVGSDKRYSFSIGLDSASDTLHVFESAIDLLSYISLTISKGKEPGCNYLSLSGIYRPGRDSPHLPVSLEHYLSKNRLIRKIVLCLDNDEAGRIASQAIKALLPDTYSVQDIPPPEGKDYNDFLMAYKQLNNKVKTRGAKSALYNFKEEISK